MTTKPKQYKIFGVLVEGVRSEGGLFYEVKILKTGDKFRVLTRIFEKFAKEVKDGIQNNARTNQSDSTKPV